MKTFLKWTLGIGAATWAGYAITRAVQRGRRSLHEGLEKAEAVADQTRQTLENTQRTIHKARTVI